MVESNHPYTAVHDMESEEHCAIRRKRTLIGFAVFILIAAIVGAIAAALVVTNNHNNNNASHANAQTSSDTSSNGQSTTKGNDPVVQIVDPTTASKVQIYPAKNPKSYPPSTCSMPNYISKDHNIYAVSTNGTTIPIQIKGINWFGMESANNIPFGLWDNGINGTTAFQIAEFLADNKFNSVRLPICIDSILKDTPPRTDIINKATNKAISVDSYMNLLKSLILALGYRNISVLISLHTLKPGTLDPLWYSNEVTENDVLNAITKVTTALCFPTYWNVLGVDVKNEPNGATWGDGQATDFQIGATTLGNKVIDGCPSWLVFVEGVYGQHSLNAEGVNIQYGDWWGAGLQNAGNKPVVLSTPNKVVYAPHYYPPSVYPQSYFYDSNSAELSSDALKKNVRLTMDAMFGYLASTQQNAMVVGEFGGLYSSDKHPKKTIQRVIEYNIELMQRPGWSGGYVWALDPESLYQYNPFNNQGDFFEGILQMDWKTPNQPYIDALKGFDDMPNLRMFPCF